MDHENLISLIIAMEEELEWGQWKHFGQCKSSKYLKYFWRAVSISKYPSIGEKKKPKNWNRHAMCLQELMESNVDKMYCHCTLTRWTRRSSFILRSRSSDPRILGSSETRGSSRIVANPQSRFFGADLGRFEARTSFSRFNFDRIYQCCKFNTEKLLSYTLLYSFFFNFFILYSQCVYEIGEHKQTVNFERISELNMKGKRCRKEGSY